MSYTDQEKIQEFERLKDFLESLDLAAEILPKGNVLDDIILLVSLPSIEEYPDDREATEADLHLAAGYLMDLDDTDQRLCKYLLFYAQIIVDLSSFERTEILENINQLNRNVRMGHYFYGPADGKEEEMLQYRVMVSGAEDQPLDEGVVADALLEMGVGYDIALHTFERAAHK